MILYTSVNRRQAVFYCKFYIGMALFFALLGGIYEMFSHQVYSAFMLLAFLVPVVLGVIPSLMAAKKGEGFPAHIVQLYAGGVIMLTMGSVMKGVLDIYGTTNRKVLLFPIIAGAMLLVAVILGLAYRAKGRQGGRPEVMEDNFFPPIRPA